MIVIDFTSLYCIGNPTNQSPSREANGFRAKGET